MIQEAFGGMIQLMMAKFIMNDMPHAAGLNNPTFAVKRTTIDKHMLDDLEFAWHRIESDMSYDMQKALVILKGVMGYCYEETAVAVYEGKDLVGVAVYEVGRDINLQVDYTHIKELASFTHKPGVGKVLVDEIIRIAKENACGEVNVSYGAGAKGFYDKLGFELHEGPGGETGTLMVYKLEGRNNVPHAAGTMNPGYEEPPTSAQLRYIAVLSAKLHMVVYYEERVRTKGEAGRMIRELKEEEKHRKQLKSGNPSYRKPVPRNLKVLVPGDMTEEERAWRWFAYEDARTKAVKEFESARGKARRDALEYGWDKATYEKALGEAQMTFHEEAEVKAREILRTP